MNPTTPTTPDPIPQQPVTPPQPLTPAPTPDPIPQAAPSVQPTSFNTAGSSSGGKKKFFLFGGIALVVLALISFLVVLPALASLQAKGRADGFMKAITAGDVTQAMTFVKNGGDAGDKEFLTLASEKVKGSYSYKESTKKDDKFYALFTLKAGAYISARTEMVNDGGKWYLDGFVYDTKELALVPGGSSSSSTAKETTTDATTPATECLSDDDVATLIHAVGGSDITDNDYKVKYREFLDSFYFFNPDSTSYLAADTAAQDIQEVATFYNTYKSKNFTIHLAGQVYESDVTASGVSLSNQRAEKIKAELVAKGVAADRVIVDKPDKPSTDDPDGSARSVELTIQAVNACQSAEASSDSSNR